MQVDLAPENVTLPRLFAYNAEGSFMLGLREPMTEGLVQWLVGESTVDLDTTFNQLGDLSREMAPVAVKGALYLESEYTSPLMVTTMTGLLSDQGVEVSPDIDLSNVAVAEPFLDAVADKIRNSATSLRILEGLQKRPELLEMLKQVYRMSLALESTGIDDLYRYLRSAADDSSIKVSHTDEAPLYFLLFLPYPMRYAVQELLEWKHDADYFLHVEATAESEEEKSFIRDYVQAKKAEIFSSYHWKELIDRFGASEEVIAAIQEDRILELSLLPGLLTRMQGEECLKLVGDYRKFLDEDFRQIERLDKETDTHYWQQIDRGHCFSGRRRFGVISPDSFKASSIKSEKTGKTAVILEDDPRQMEAFAASIEGCSEFSIMDGGRGRCSRPEEVTPLLRDPNVGFFLIDIESGEDQTAGIRVARRILDELLPRYLGRNFVERFRNRIRRPHADKIDPAVIVVWSRSPALVKEAEKNLHQYIEDKGWFHYITTSRRHCAGDPVRLVVKLKTESPFDS